MIAYHQLYHARKLVKNVRKAWETKKIIHDDVLSPSRVQRGMGDLINQLPCIVEEVKPRGKTTGNRPGAKIITRVDRDVVKKSSPKPIVMMMRKNQKQKIKKRVRNNERNTIS